jgi:DNA-binding NarL/FixJ family response regulator
MPTTRILLVDDHLLARAGARALLDTLPDHEVVAECADGHEALEAIKKYKPDVVLLDILMPGLSGIEVTKMLRKNDEQTKILILSIIDRLEIVEQALALGANGYLLKDFILEELKRALSEINSHGRYLSPRLEAALAIRQESPMPQTPTLTSRQMEILRLVASGMTTKTIAKDLGISPKTVEFHRAQLMERIGVRDVTGLTRYAMLSGLVS